MHRCFREVNAQQTQRHDTCSHVYRYRVKFHSKKSNDKEQNSIVSNPISIAISPKVQKKKKKRIESSSKELRFRVKVSTRTEILHCPNSLQFPCRRFSLSLRLTGETASWPLGEKRKYRGTRKEERGKKKRKEERKKIKKRAVERRIYFHGV